MPLEQLQPAIDFLGQTHPLAHQVDGADAAVVDRPAPVGHLKMDVAGAHHRRLCLSPPTLGIQTAFDSALAVSQDFAVSSVHSKCFFLGWVSLISSQKTKYLKAFRVFCSHRVFKSRLLKD